MENKYIKRIEKLEKAFNTVVDRIITNPSNELALSKEIKKELCEFKKVTELIEMRYITPNYIPANRED